MSKNVAQIMKSKTRALNIIQKHNDAIHNFCTETGAKLDLARQQKRNQLVALYARQIREAEAQAIEIFK